MSDEPFALSPVSRPIPPSEAEYEAICQAVMETERGRWFLAEYARRHRGADTKLLLTALTRIEARLRGEEPSQSLDRFVTAITEMAQTIALMKAALAAAVALDHPAVDLDGIVPVAERTTAGIVAAIERVQEVAWSMRDCGLDAAFCDALDGSAAEISAACAVHDLGGRRIAAAVEALRQIEDRISSLADVWATTTENPSEEAAAPIPEPEPAPAEAEGAAAPAAAEVPEHAAVSAEAESAQLEAAVEIEAAATAAAEAPSETEAHAVESPAESGPAPAIAAEPDEEAALVAPTALPAEEEPFAPAAGSAVDETIEVAVEVLAGDEMMSVRAAVLEEAADHVPVPEEAADRLPQEPELTIAAAKAVGEDEAGLLGGDQPSQAVVETPSAPAAELEGPENEGALADAIQPSAATPMSTLPAAPAEEEPEPAAAAEPISAPPPAVLEAEPEIEATPAETGPDIEVAPDISAGATEAVTEPSAPDNVTAPQSAAMPPPAIAEPDVSAELADAETSALAAQAEAAEAEGEDHTVLPENDLNDLTDFLFEPEPVVSRWSSFAALPQPAIEPTAPPPRPASRRSEPPLPPLLFKGLPAMPAASIMIRREGDWAAEIKTPRLETAIVAIDREPPVEPGAAAIRLAEKAEALLPHLEEADRGVAQDEVARDAATADEVTRDEVAESEIAETNVAESEVAESQVAEGKVAEGEVAEGEVAEGEVAEGKVAESETVQGEVVQGDAPGDQVTETSRPVALAAPGPAPEEPHEIPTAASPPAAPDAPMVPLAAATDTLARPSTPWGREAAEDPLAAIVALTDEEKIALFG